MEVGATPSRVRHHLVIVLDDVALAFTVNDVDTEPDGTDTHERVGAAIATVVVVVGATVVVVAGATVVVVVVGTSTRGTFEFKVYEPELEEK